jgi:dimethylargininase
MAPVNSIARDYIPDSGISQAVSSCIINAVGTVAITRDVSASLANCELTHLARAPIDVALARAEHAAYERALAEAGCRVERLPADEHMPDSVFVEDIAIVFDELAIVTRPGAASRRRERVAISAALKPYRTLRAIEPPGTLDGGDVLTVGTRVFAGVSTRTTADAVAQLQQLLGPYGYTVCAIPVDGCLHLKSAVTALGDEVLLANRAWLPSDAFRGYDIVDVDPGEPAAANALRLADRIIFPAAFPRTADRIERRGFTVATVDASELAKAEGAVTCCSLVFEDGR